MIVSKQSLVKQCPCFREFRNEHLCVNGSDVRPVVKIELDADLLVSGHLDQGFTSQKSDDRDLCYCMAYRGEDDLYYCISQQEAIQVQGRVVSQHELDSARQMLEPDGVHYSTVLCGECLYNIIASLREHKEPHSVECAGET